MKESILELRVKSMPNEERILMYQYILAEKQPSLERDQILYVLKHYIDEVYSILLEDLGDGTNKF